MKEKLDLYIKAAQSKIGIWKINLQTNDVFWDESLNVFMKYPLTTAKADTAVNFYTQEKS
jgi:hypothetical protein